MIRILLAVLVFGGSALAGPRDVRNVLAKNGFVPAAKLEGSFIVYPEPSITAWPHGDAKDPVFPGEEGSLYILLCFTCAEMSIQQHGGSIADADIHYGRDKLLEFVRSSFPANKRFKTLVHPRKRLDRTADQLSWAAAVIPEDPLLKQLLTMKPRDISEDALEELDTRCIAGWKKLGEQKLTPDPSLPNIPGLEPIN